MRDFEQEIARLIRHAEKETQKFREKAAEGISIDYIARWLTGPAVAAEEQRNVLYRIQRLEDLEAEIKRLEDRVFNGALGGTHRSTCGWSNAAEETKLCALADLLRSLRGIRLDLEKLGAEGSNL